jgi:hypothetical protein
MTINILWNTGVIAIIQINLRKVWKHFCNSDNNKHVTMNRWPYFVQTMTRTYMRPIVCIEFCNLHSVEYYGDYGLNY